jgi:hypothetical protein
MDAHVYFDRLFSRQEYTARFKAAISEIAPTLAPSYIALYIMDIERVQ